MALKNIQLCHADAVNREEGRFTVTVHHEDGNQLAVFDCSSEADAIALRNAIRDHADRLRRAANYNR